MMQERTRWKHGALQDLAREWRISYTQAKRLKPEHIHLLTPLGCELLQEIVRRDKRRSRGRADYTDFMLRFPDRAKIDSESSAETIIKGRSLAQWFERFARDDEFLGWAEAKIERERQRVQHPQPRTIRQAIPALNGKEPRICKMIELSELVARREIANARAS